MEISVTGRHTSVPERFRRHIEDKLAKVSQLDPRVTRCEVVVTHEPNPRQAKEAERVEITCFAKRSVIRAEAAADEEYAALDLATTRLGERLRREHDKRRVHRGRKQPISVHAATAGLPADLPDDQSAEDGQQQEVPPSIAKIGGDEDCPVELREKVHASVPMTVDQALNAMELVGHDFYLFHDADTDRPSVVYRRRGWSYGVIHLQVDAQPATHEATASA
ncbi:ribosome-associated translation inhibitor RaiA [Calidifontibacter sp. DB0510]|uniref:Ribosome hibernation promoting factor n=1 Tax=Metallococcus carri TaxID=1656884 RepID=A0A967AX20_9MICO|nr:ribosome-associated translation inhibitor RaiA [Metallococcus carri]NHN54554.1 ribosome-associated translation inhibitor RaiA [Metallococcus carri]NOP36607.1 ribosome-associated translation inhibitor RaiA [Calidifontibacter sp. DB2511S]